MTDENRRQTYREWLDTRFNEEIEDDDEDPNESEPEESPDGFPLHDDYSEESAP